MVRAARPMGTSDARPDPVVIFATGGSGTRAVARIVQRAGYFVGTDLTAAHDSWDMLRFFGKWLDRYVVESDWVNRVLAGLPVSSDAASPEMEEDFSIAIERHRAGLSDQRGLWGWKGPRSIYFLPFLRGLYPGMMAIHLVRDGRDMAYSKNQWQLRRHGRPHLLDPSIRALPEPAQSITLWSWINRGAARYAEQTLGSSYLRMRFEDLCSDPPAGVETILRFIGRDASPADVRAIGPVVEAPPTIDRWRGQDSEELEAVTATGREGLLEFGYL